MNTVVLDTNVVSYLLRHDPLADLYLADITGRRLAVSFMTVGELHEGALRARWGARKVNELERLLVRHLIIPATRAVCFEWARIRHERRARPISVSDAWIAVSARAYRLPLLSHDRDFQGIRGLEVVTRRIVDR